MFGWRTTLQIELCVCVMIKMFKYYMKYCSNTIAIILCWHFVFEKFEYSLFLNSVWVSFFSTRSTALGYNIKMKSCWCMTKIKINYHLFRIYQFWINENQHILLKENEFQTIAIWGRWKKLQMCKYWFFMLIKRYTSGLGWPKKKFIDKFQWKYCLINQEFGW